MIAKIFSRNQPTAPPLAIDTVPVSVSGGLIGMCACPGGRRYLGGRNASAVTLEADIATVVDFAPRGVVSLLESPEIEALGIGDMPAMLAEHGIEWRHLPIRDMHPPGPSFESLWITHGAMLRYQLQSGSKVLLHCFAGLGRTGTIAGRLLVEFGAAPGEAIDTLRGARRGAVQTTSQEDYVRACTRVA